VENKFYVLLNWKRPLVGFTGIVFPTFHFSRFIKPGGILALAHFYCFKDVLAPE
jgi:hypothetical protein